MGLVLQASKGNIKGEYKKQIPGRCELESWLDHLRGLGNDTHREESLGLTVLICKMGIAIIAPLSHLRLL